MEARAKWDLLHEYRRLASLSVVPEVKCPQCGDDTYPIVDTDDSPALKCMSSCSVVHLGRNMYVQMQGNIEEFRASLRNQKGNIEID